eukprot:UN18079
MAEVQILNGKIRKVAYYCKPERVRSWFRRYGEVEFLSQLP